MHGQLATQSVAAAGSFDGIDVTDQVGDGDIRGSQFFHITVFRGEVLDANVISDASYFVAAPAADRGIRIVVNLAASKIGHEGIEKSREGPQNTALRLAPQSQQNEIV